MKKVLTLFLGVLISVVVFGQTQISAKSQIVICLGCRDGPLDLSVGADFKRGALSSVDDPPVSDSQNYYIFTVNIKYSSVVPYSKSIGSYFGSG